MLTPLVKSVTQLQDISIPSDASLEEALEVMTRNNEGTVVLLKDKKPLAIMTERDVVSIIYKDIPLTKPALMYSSEPVISVRNNRDVGYCLHIMIDNNIRRVVVTDENGEFSGIVSQQNLIKQLESGFYKESLKAHHLLHNRPILKSISGDSTLSDALESMLNLNIGALPIMQDNKLVGIITEHDVLHLANKKVSLQTNVLEYAKKPVYTVKKDCLVEEIVEKMIQRDFRRVVICDKKGIPTGILNNRDIFRHIEKNYNAFLEIKIKHAKEILNYIPEIIIEVIKINDENIIQWCNKKASDIFGDFLIDKPITNYIGEELWQQVVKGIQIDGKVDNITIEIGEGIYEISSYQLKPFESDLIQLILKDVTQLEALNRTLTDRMKKETEKRMHQEQLLIHQSKLAEMGEMIGLIAHQWKQPLNNLGLIIQDLEEAYDYGEMNKSYLEQIIKNSVEQIDFMSTTIDDFRNFFRPSKEITPFRVDEAFRQVFSILSPQMKRNYIDIHLVTNHSDNDRIVGMENEFKQVILNLLNNSKDAIVDSREKGNLNEEEKGDIFLSTETQEGKLIICISDNGGGISDSAINNVFESYFTTKEDSIGTGIGLHMCKVIIEEKMGGQIFGANKGNGAIFTLKLPLFKG